MQILRQYIKIDVYVKLFHICLAMFDFFSISVHLPNSGCPLRCTSQKLFSEMLTQQLSLPTGAKQSSASVRLIVFCLSHHSKLCLELCSSNHWPPLTSSTEESTVLPAGIQILKPQTLLVLNNPEAQI